MNQQRPATMRNYSHHAIPVVTSAGDGNTLRKATSEQTYFTLPRNLFKKTKSKSQEVIERLDSELESVFSEKELMLVRGKRSEKELAELKEKVADNSRCIISVNQQLDGVNDRMKETLSSIKFSTSGDPWEMITYDNKNSDHGETDTAKMAKLLTTAETYAEDLSTNASKLICKVTEIQQEKDRKHKEADLKKQNLEQNLKFVKEDSAVLLQKVIELTGQVDTLTEEVQQQKKQISTLKEWKIRARKQLHTTVIKLKKKSWF